MIRDIAPTDLDALAAIHRQCFPDDFWSADSLAASLADGGGAVWATDEPAGFALYRAVGDEAELLTIAVAPAHRRQGIARQLMAWVVSAAAKTGAETLFLEVGADNAEALALYQTCGMLEVGRRPGYYRRGARGLGSRRVDAAILARRLDRE